MTQKHILVYLWLIHVDTWQKTTKFYKAIILQIKKRKHKLFSWIGRNSTVKIIILLKAIYRFNAIPIKYERCFFSEVEHFKIFVKIQKTLNCKKKKKSLGEEQSWRNHIPWIWAIIQSYSNQHCLVLAQKQTHGSAEQSRETINKPHNYDQLVHDKASRSIKWRKYSLFSKWCWENCTTTCRRMELEHFLSPYTKVNSKWFKI